MKNYHECTTIPYITLKKCVEIPDFHRDITWKNDDRKKFIETLRAGFPFGSLLLYKLSEEKYLLVDGLQRFSTIQSFENNPCDYLDLSTIAEKEIKKLIKIISDYKGYELPDAEQTSIQKTFIQLYEKYSNDDKANIIEEVIENLLYSNDCPTEIILELWEVVNSIKKCISTEIDLETLHIPVVIFSGNYSDLNLVYKNINQLEV